MAQLLQIRKGDVKFVHKGYGYICLDDSSDEIFFLVKDGRKIKEGARVPYFAQGSTIEETPKKNDRVVFIIEYNEKGKIAQPWGYESEYKKVLNKIQRRNS